MGLDLSWTRPGLWPRAGLRLMTRAGQRLADRHDSGPGLPAEQGDSGGGQGERGQRGGNDRRALAGGEDVARQAQRDDRGRNAELGGRGETCRERLPRQERGEDVHRRVERDQQRRERDQDRVLAERTQVDACPEDDEEERHQEALRDSGDLPREPFRPAIAATISPTPKPAMSTLVPLRCAIQASPKRMSSDRRRSSAQPRFFDQRRTCRTHGR